jgi:hypothetical protein
MTKIKMRVFKQVNVNLSLSHVEQSGDNRANGARLSDLIAKAIQSEIKDEIHADRKDLHQLREIEVSHEPSVRRWLQTEIAVLEARLAFPTNEVLIQLDEMLDTREALNREGKRLVLARLHARLAELQPGG